MILKDSSSLYSPGWPRIHNPPVSVFLVLRLQACHNTQIVTIYYFICSISLKNTKLSFQCLHLNVSKSRLNWTQTLPSPCLDYSSLLHCLYQGPDKNLHSSQVILPFPRSSHKSINKFCFQFCTSDPPTILHFHCHHLFLKIMFHSCSSLIHYQIMVGIIASI